MRYLTEPKYVFVKCSGISPFAKNMGQNISKNISENLGGKNGQKPLDDATKYTSEALKTASRKAIKKRQKLLVIGNIWW